MVYRCVVFSGRRVEKHRNAVKGSVTGLVIPERWLYPGALVTLLPRDHRGDVWVHALLSSSWGFRSWRAGMAIPVE